MKPLEGGATVAPGDSMLTALRRLQPQGRKRLLVMHEDRLDGLLCASDVSRFVELRSLAAQPA
jgi:hypothetical protein